MGLKLTLKPGEKVAINGAVIVNGDRRVEFAVENHASILRERDIMQASEANTPAKRIYLPVMMMALDSAMRAKAYPEFEQRLLEFTGAVTDPAALADCLKVSAEVANENYYKALSHCRALIEFESKRLPDVA